MIILKPYKGFFLIFAGVFLNHLPALLLFMDPIKTDQLKPFSNSKPVIVDEKENPKTKTFLKTAAYWIYVAQQILLNVGVACGCLYTAAHIVKVSDADEMDAAFMISLQGGIEALIRIPFGYLADRKRFGKLFKYFFGFKFIRKREKTIHQ